MKRITLRDLQASVQDKNAFAELGDYLAIAKALLKYLSDCNATRIISPTHSNYVFYQFGKEHGHKITRPLNTDLFIESEDVLESGFDLFMSFLERIKKYQEQIHKRRSTRAVLETNTVNRIVYTVQQSIGCIGDSFESPNQSRKRIGQLFENLVRLIIRSVGLACEGRTVNLPIPGHPGYEMSYELDLVLSRNKAIIASETRIIGDHEIVGSVKTTSKDRIDKVFLDKYLLTKLMGKDIPVIAVFLHDVQRAVKGNSIFGINSTFKSNHFLGYTVALNRLDGVYYVDPRPDMISNERLREQISDFQRFLVHDLWTLSDR
jgi:hypothetical protein